MSKRSFWGNLILFKWNILTFVWILNHPNLSPDEEIMAIFLVDLTVKSWEIDLTVQSWVYITIWWTIKDNVIAFIYEWMVQWGSWIFVVIVFQLPKALWSLFGLQIDLYFSLIRIFNAKLSNGTLSQSSQYF